MVDYKVRHREMISGSSEAERRRFHKVTGKDGKVWLYADQANPADNIYVEGGPDSDGFGRRELTFTLVDLTELKLKGPWHSNSTALFQATGVDLRDKHRTFVVVSKGVTEGWGDRTMTDVLYKDDGPQIGENNRGDKIAQALANVMGKPVFLHIQFHGGGSDRFVAPEKADVSEG